MRQRYQNRSIFGIVFWSLLLGGTTVYTAWKFDWLSIDLSEMIGRRIETSDKADLTAIEQQDDKPADGATVEGAVFHDQSEPPVEFVADEAPELTRPEQETTARLRELQQRQTARDATSTVRGTLDPEFSARVPSNPFADEANATPQHRTTAGEDQGASAAEPTQSRVADFRPRGSNAFPNSGAGLTKQASKRRLPQSEISQSEPHGSERVIQASNEEPQLAAPPVSAAVTEALHEIDRLIGENDILSAHRELSKAYWSHPELRGVLRQRIEKTAETIYFSPQPHFLEPYVVQDGDQFAKFAKMYDVPWQYLAKLNRVDPTRIRAGQKLKVIRGPFSAVVELSRFEMTIHAHGYYVRRFDVGIGKQGSSPVGKHVVLEKVANPQYTDPEGRVIDADDPSNPLGERWIDLGNGYGIHGTIEPDSIGKAQSRGCIRLRNDDVAEVYDLLGVGSEVVIRQ